MRQKSMSKNGSAERTVRDSRCETRKQYTAEEKIRIVVSGLRGEETIAALCRRDAFAEGSVLQLVERVFGSGQEAARRRYRAPSDLGRG